MDVVNLQHKLLDQGIITDFKQTGNFWSLIVNGKKVQESDSISFLCELLEIMDKYNQFGPYVQAGKNSVLS